MSARTRPRATSVTAPAKVNLFLRVLGRRPDGYHEVRTLMQAVDLADDVVVELGRAPAPGGPRVELRVEGPAPCPPEENLAWRAAERFACEAGLEGVVRILLRKRIPAGGGLGGGSSDAAAVLRALGHLEGADVRDGSLRAAAAAIGSDVPFFLCGSPLALATGRGEVLEPLPPLPEAHLVLCLPPVEVPTGWAYGALARFRGGEAAGSGGGLGVGSGEPEVAPADPVAPRTWDDVALLARNDFEAVVPGARPEVARSLGALRARGAAFALLCGSGAASFGLFEDGPAAEAAAGALREELGWPCLTVRTLTAVPRPT